MSTCGRCRGRGYIKPTIGFGDLSCPGCKGTGVKVQKSSLGRGKVSIPLPPGAMCIVCGDRPAVQMHHICKQSRIDRIVPDELLRAAKSDPRNGVPACVHCHGGLDDESIQLEPRQVPRGFPAFVAQYDLETAMPRYMACGAAAPTTTSVCQETVVIREVQSSREVPR